MRTVLITGGSEGIGLAAGELLAALRNRKAPRVISGFATRLMIRLHRLVSRKTAINMMGTSSPLES